MESASVQFACSNEGERCTLIGRSEYVGFFDTDEGQVIIDFISFGSHAFFV